MSHVLVSHDVPASFYWTASFGRSEDDASTLIVDGTKALKITIDESNDEPAYLRTALFETKFPGSRSITSRGNAMLQVPGGASISIAPRPTGAPSSSFKTVTFSPSSGARPLKVHGQGRVVDVTSEAVSREKAAEARFRKAMVASASPTFDYLRSYLSGFVDYSYCGFSANFSGLYLPRAFEATPEYVFGWLLEAAALFMYMNPVESFGDDIVGEALWTNILTAAAGPYELEKIDARDTPILLSGIGDDCDGATMIAGDVHLFVHEHRPELSEILKHSSHPAAAGLRCGMEWAWSKTEPTPAMMVCNADPDVAFGATSLSKLPELGLHEALLLQRKGSPGFLLVETTCFSHPSICPDKPGEKAKLDAAFPVAFDPANSMGYNQMKPFDDRKYPNILTIQQGPKMWVSQGLLSLKDVLCSSLSDRMKAVSVPLERPHPVSPIPNLSADDALRQRLQVTKAPSGVTVVSAKELMPGSRTSQTTAMPGHSAPKLPADGANRALGVGPFSWIIAEFKGSKYLGRTDVEFSAHGHHAVL